MSLDHHSVFAYNRELQAQITKIYQAKPADGLAVLQAAAAEFAARTVCGLYHKDLAVDRLIDAAVGAGLVDRFGQEAVETAIGDGFTMPRIEAPPLQPGQGKGKALMVQLASDIVEQPIEWLWPNRMAVGKLTLIGGMPGIGKSQFTTFLAAAVTARRPLPCGEGAAPQGKVLILSAEDDAADTIKPRLMAAGADCSKVAIVTAVRAEGGAGERTFNLQADLDILEQYITQEGDVRLIVIDPITAYTGNIDSHNNAQVRAVLTPVTQMAARLRVAICAVTHLNKAKGANAINSFIGSIGYVATSRGSFLIARDPDDDGRRLFALAKPSIGPESEGGLAFRVCQSVVGDNIVAPTIEWESSHVTITADEIVAATAEPAGDKHEAVEFLAEMLAPGPLPVKTLMAAAEEGGMPWIAVRRAKKALGVSASRQAADPMDATQGGQWIWSLPSKVIKGV
jgi:putative DNA primase/helicase